MDQTKQSDSKIKTVGIIIPPSEIRKIADKTAEFVAKNGPSFEDLVIKAETNNPKFSFLKQDDPYRSYYDHKVSEFGKQVANEAQAQSKTQESISSSINIQNTKPISFPSQNQLPQSNQNNIINNNISQKNKNDLRMPLADQYTVEHPANVTMLDIDIIKHTAQFVAKNGKNFLIALTEREKQNPQFDFLKPTHILFSFFTNLVDAYSKCIYVKKEELQKLQLNIQERMHILNRALERFEYEYMQKQVKKKKEEIDEEERMQMAQIDWNDFIIVETIDLFENEELPAPHSFDKNNEKIKLKNQQIEIEEKKISIPLPLIPGKLLPQPQVQIPNLQEIQLSISEQLIPLNVEENTKVKKNYVRKSGNSEYTTVKCDVCGHNIPVNEYNEHLRIELMDPKHQIMKQDLSQRAQNTAIATGEELSQNLQIFSKKRPDIFGTAEDQFNKEEQKKKQAAAAAEKNLWDNNPINRLSSNLPLIKKNIEEIKIPPKPEKPVSIPLNRTLIDDIKTVTEEKKPNLIPEKPIINPDIPISHLIPPPIIPPMNLPIPINKPSMPLIMDPTKFVREENVNLIPEERWLELNPHNLQINIKIPDGGSEDNWNFNGQIIQLEVDPRTKIGRIKDLLSGLLGDMPVSKQKLKSTMFSVLKDQHSLAYYNMINGLMLELNAKERGGKSRKK